MAILAELGDVTLGHQTASICTPCGSVEVLHFTAPSLSVDEALGQVMATVISKAEGLDISEGASPTTRKIAASSNDDTSQLMTDVENLISVIDLKFADHKKAVKS